MNPIKMAVSTADGNYEYYFGAYNGLNLLELATLVNEKLESINGWDKSKLTPGKFGTDIMVSRIGKALSTNSISTDDIETICKNIHSGWIECFKYWWLNEPWKRQDGNYTAPFWPLGDAKRCERARCDWNNLESRDKMTIYQIATILRECITSDV